MSKALKLLKKEIMTLFEDQLLWDFDGSWYISNLNYDGRMKDFEEELDKILSIREDNKDKSSIH